MDNNFLEIIKTRRSCRQYKERSKCIHCPDTFPDRCTVRKAAIRQRDSIPSDIAFLPRACLRPSQWRTQFEYQQQN